MACSDCERLRLVCELITRAHLDIVHMHEADKQAYPPGKEPEIWHFILGMAVTARSDAERALEEHEAQHNPSSVRSTSMFLLPFLHTDLWEFSDQLLGAL